MPEKGTTPRIALAGALAQKPGKSGHAWVFLQYLLGLRDLGFRPLFIDQVQGPLQDEQRRWFHEVLSHPARPLEGLLLDSEGCPFAFQPDSDGAPESLSQSDCLALIEDSRALINVQGFLRDPQLLQAARRRIFLDIDPGFTQMWQDLGLTDFLDGHDAYATVGGRVGQPDCAIPTCGKDWIRVLPPVHLPSWPSLGGGGNQPVPMGAGQAPRTRRPPLTSVISWRGAYGPLQYRERSYGLRVHEFRRFWDLPVSLADDEVKLQLAIDIDPADAQDRKNLVSRGWDLVPASGVAGDLDGYRDYISSSLGEFLVAKNIYVETRSGWFSDRSACYLASGCPVVAQDTGLAGLLPCHGGLLTFSTPEEAVRQIRGLLGDYPSHSRAARRIAQEHLDAAQILPSLLEQAGVKE